MTKKKAVLLIIIIILALAAMPGLRIIADTFSKKTAYQFTVNNEKWFTVSNKASLQRMLNGYKKQYLVDVDDNARIKQVVFKQKIKINKVKVKSEEIDTLKKAKEKIYAVEQPALEIAIKKGDNFWSLSRANHITENELEILNPDIDPDKIFPGQKVVVKPPKPKLDVLVELENKVVEPIPFTIEYRKDNGLYKSQKRIVREGIEGQKEVVYNITLTNGYQSSLKIINQKNLKDPLNAIVQIGTKITASMGGRVKYGVVGGTMISSRYGYRIHPITGQRRFHSGLDIAAAYGSPVYAYTGGRIIQAGWNGGYGKSILIDHGNGLRTRYGHLSKINVRIGQKVAAGTLIGAVGSTGNSTGPHLHFEVIKWGWTKNPMNYI